MPDCQYIIQKAWLFTTIVFFIGCDNAIEPLAEDANSFVFVNGFLDSAADSQFVRLEGLRPTILAEPRNLSNVAVTTNDNFAGKHTVWKDSLIVLDDGSSGHLFIGVFNPKDGREYELIIGREGFEAATARTTIPKSPDVQPGEAAGEKANFIQNIFLEGLDVPPFSLAMRYEILIPATGEVRTFLIDYGDAAKLSGSGWQFDAFLFRDQQVISFALDRIPTAPRHGLRRVAATIVIKSEEWDEADKPVNLSLAQGFFGSIGRFNLGWVLDPDDVDKMGFFDDQNSWQGGKQDLFGHPPVLLDAPRNDFSETAQRLRR